MKKIITLVLLCTTLFVLDNVLMPFFSIKGYYPSLLFVFIISYSIVSGSKEGLILGIFTGFLQDIFFTQVIGINMLLNMLVCLAAAEIGRNIFEEKRVVPVISCFVLSAVKGILLFVLLYIIGININIKIVLFGSLYNMIVSIFVYKFVYRLGNLDFMIRKWKF